MSKVDTYEGLMEVLETNASQSRLSCGLKTWLNQSIHDAFCPGRTGGRLAFTPLGSEGNATLFLRCRPL